ncbi:MAG: hypothetical protein ISS15_08005 [Alphaproteobacteria bacterium]|nr:hypothetical protein [Alphaproteobacteria bacterium]MBL7097584.1 hypothetical protein [Alphaproteobacteria bacterium]
MVRVLNTLCVALMGLAILALYHVSEGTRVASVELQHVQRDLRQERVSMSVLETEWERVAGPAQIQALAARDLGLNGTPAVQLSSFDALPRRGDNDLSDTPIRNASAEAPAPSTSHTGL